MRSNLVQKTRAIGLLVLDPNSCVLLVLELELPFAANKDVFVEEDAVVPPQWIMDSL